VSSAPQMDGDWRALVAAAHPEAALPLGHHHLLTCLIRFQGGRCAFCGQPFQDHGARRPTIDHLRPLWSNGRDDVSNRVASCYGCNDDKGALHAVAYMALRFNPQALRIARARAEDMAHKVDRAARDAHRNSPRPRRQG
jgi:HNH endonuclease